MTTRSKATPSHLAEKALLEYLTPPSVVIDESGRIVHVHGDTARYLKPSSTESPRDLQSQIIGEPLAAAVRDARRAGNERGVASARAGWNEPSQPRRCVDVVVRRLEPADPALYLVSFLEGGETRRLDDIPTDFAPRDALRQAKDDAEAAKAARDHFLTTISHELRTPLTPMMLWAQVLDREEVPDRALLREGLGMIRQCTEEQHALIEKLLDTSRIMAGKIRLAPGAADLSQIAQSALDTARPAAVAKEVTLESSLDAATGTAWADPERLRQIIAQLLDNAVKFTPPGGRVSLFLRRADDHVEFQVTDTGVGISAENLPRLFSGFGPLGEAANRSAGSLGLGLSIVRKLVELHGGTVRAHSEGPDRGATFLVRLPLDPPAAVSAQTARR